MMGRQADLKTILSVGLMLFSFFFGAGNLIFPPVLGQLSGSEVGWANFGFCLSAVGLPLLGILAMTMNGFKKPDDAAKPAAVWYARTVAVLSALSIGPFFAIPRTAATSYDAGIKPLLGSDIGMLGMFCYSVVFFGITYYLSTHPNRIVDVVGKLMTPSLLVCIALLCFSAFTDPMGGVGAPQGEYAVHPLVKGIFEGYNTMDALCAMIFGAATITIIETIGVKDKSELTQVTMYAGLIAAACLGIIYCGLSYVGAGSFSTFGEVSNGATLLNMIAVHYYGMAGKIISALIFFLACITTSIGLTVAICQYFNQLFGFVYERLVLVTCIFALGVSNVGLNNIIAYSIPMLVMLYPIIIVLVLLNIFTCVFHRIPCVFRLTLGLTSLVAVNDGLCCAGIKVLEPCFSWLPFYDLGLGWVVPATVGAVIGLVIIHLCGGKRD